MSVVLKHVALFCSILCVFIVFPSHLANAQFFDCHTIVKGMYYNLSSLSGTQITGFDANYHWQFFLEVCAVAPACHRDGAMACQMDVNTKEVWDLAFPNDNVDTHYWSAIPGGVEGIQLTAFGSGINCATVGNERKSIVRVYCDRNITATPTNFSAPVEEGPVCTYRLYLNHTAGCGIPYHNTTQAPPTAPTCTNSAASDDSKVTGAGFATGLVVGLVIAVAAVVSYIWFKRRQGGGAAASGNKWNKLGPDDKSVALTSVEGETHDM